MPNYQHKEAFCLMWYGCPCGHHERMWNSRDGVTPFCMNCPSCGDDTLHHIEWDQDRCVPDHVPHEGQRIWVPYTLDEARKVAKLRVELGKTMVEGDEEALIERLTKHIYEGRAPNLRVVAI